MKISQETIVQKVKEEYGGNVRKASRELNIPRRTLRRWLTGETVKEYKRFIVTYAQNKTPIHQGFFDALDHYIKEWDCELICYRGKYRNPTSEQEANKEKPNWWDDKITPYLMDSNRKLNNNLVIYPARTQPTAVNPLSGYDAHTRDKSGIFPHPKIRFKTVATHQKMAKILTTTGAITEKNYSISKAGEKGKFHHVIGAVVVEVVDNDKFHIRHINAEADGSFFDMAGGRCWKYTPEGIEKAKHYIDVLTMGDIQFPFIDQVVYKATRDLIKRLRPIRIYLHDVIDFWRQNHHERYNRFLKTAKAISGEAVVKDEIAETATFLQQLANPKKYSIQIVTSNHDEALDRWLHDESLDHVGINAEYFHWLSYNKHKSAQRVSYGFKFNNTLEFAIGEFLDLKKANIRFIGRENTDIYNGIDYSLHGDKGANGSRGNVTSISKIGTKSVIGHTHSPAIYDGCYQVGVKSIIPLGYAKDAPSSWMHTDCITYTNGKRTLITYIDGEYYLKS